MVVGGCLAQPGDKLLMRYLAGQMNLSTPRKVNTRVSQPHRQSVGILADDNADHLGVDEVALNWLSFPSQVVAIEIESVSGGSLGLRRR